MKKLITSALALLLITGAAQAQTKDERSHQQGRAPLHALNLTEAQKARMKTLREDERKQMEALRNDPSLSAEQSRARRKELHEQYAQRMRSVLTADQQAQLEKRKAERGAAAREGRGHGRGMKGGKGQHKGWDKDRAERMAKELNLTEAQKAQLRTQYEATRSATLSIRSDQSLTEQQRREKIKALHAERKQKMESILSPEQRVKAQELLKEHKKGTRKPVTK